MTRVFCDLSGFPTILRHDRSKSFLGEVIKEVNRTFGMTSVVGSSWRPQSQGKIETQHRKLSQMLKQLCESAPENWDQKVAYAVWAWRTTPQPSLGGLSPYRIITGMQPRAPFGSATAPLGRTRGLLMNGLSKSSKFSNTPRGTYVNSRKNRLRSANQRRRGTPVPARLKWAILSWSCGQRHFPTCAAGLLRSPMLVRS